MEFEVYEDTGGEYRWRLTASNGEKVAASGQHFDSKSNAKRAAEGFKVGAKSAMYAVWETNGKWYWDAKAANGEKIATGGESFVSKYDAERAADNVRDNAGKSDRTIVRRQLLAVALVIAAAVVAAPGALAAPEAHCSPYMFIGVRGSGDPQDTMGSQVGPEWGALRADLQGSGINVDDQALINDLALHYPAVPVVHTYHVLGHAITGPDVQATAYAGSVFAGTAEILREAKRCKDSKLILAGHSQGAHAIMLALPLLDHRRIAAVTLFGDPVFRGDSYAGRGDFDSRRNGLAAGVTLPVGGVVGLTAGILKAISENAYPADLKGRLFDYCNAGDGVCQGVFHCSFSDGCQVNDFATHSEYCAPAPECPDGKGLTSEAAAIIARLIRDDQTAQGKPIAEPAPQSKGPVDVVFAIDTTGSMASIIDSVRADVEAMAGQIASVEPDFRLALVAYRDALPYCDDEYQTTTAQDFTTDAAAFSDAVGLLVATGGCDEDESVFTGAMQGLGLAFRPGATKVEILVGDAPGHDPDPVTGYRASDVIARAQAQSVSIYGLDGDAASPTFSQLTDPTGGKVVSTDESDQVPAAIQQAITAQATAPSAVAGGSGGSGSLVRETTAAAYSGPVGAPLALSAGESWSPLGRALTYRWDFDSDGVPDLNTDLPVIAHTWSAPFDGDVTLTVTDSAGQSAVTRVHVMVAGGATAAPATPRKAHVSRSGAGVRITWQAGHGGGAVSAFVIHSSRGAILAYVAPKKRAVQATTLSHVDKRVGFRVRISALNVAAESHPSAFSNIIRAKRKHQQPRHPHMQRLEGH